MKVARESMKFLLFAFDMGSSFEKKRNENEQSFKIIQLLIFVQFPL